VNLALSQRFTDTFPDGVFGALIVGGCPNRPAGSVLAARTRAIEASLRARHVTEPIDARPVARAYAAYFKRYGQRYPVTHQARTILGGRPIESPWALVEAMFAAEVDTLVLTSGHDLDALSGALLVDVGLDGEGYTKLNGKDQAIAPGDMVVRDAVGVIASVLYGPDFRTRLRETSRAALFGAWCPEGVAADFVRSHLDSLATLIAIEWPQATIEPPQVLASRGPSRQPL
jgi:DNA/RNA-binding domain of Phe-tRNA-synthetase-like protein